MMTLYLVMIIMRYKSPNDAQRNELKPPKRIQEALTVPMLNGEVSAVQPGYSIASDLDSHATIIVLVPIVHAAITYDCPYTQL
jgi:hypothetical protein